jgi:heme oxygenase
LQLPVGMMHPSLAGVMPTLMARLRDATATIRDREILLGRVSWLDYRLYLLRMYGFHAAVEPALVSSRQLMAIVPDARMRNHKAALLAHDLIVLGVEPRELVQLPRMMFAESLSFPEALGWAYVVENMTLGGKQLAHHLVRQLPTEIRNASAYLRCYGDEVSERWQEFGVAVDRCEQAIREGDRVVAAAREGFLQLRAWMRPALPVQQARIRA